MTMTALFPPGGVSIPGGATVLKAGEYADFVEAGRLLEAARIQAAATVEKAEIEAETRRREGYEEGLNEGKFEVSAQLFESVTASVEQLARMEASLVDVVLRSVRTILGSFDREELVAQVVGHALRLVRDEKKVLLRVASEDAAAVENRLADLVRRYPGMGRVDVMADASLTPGGCVMETDIGVVDATLDRQLQIIEDTFRRHLEERPV